jgi:deoxycytidine triphosphate deaminase
LYLVDRDIKALLSEMNVECPNSDHPFNPDEQIQPASIDLRIADVFWKPSRRRYWWRRLRRRDVAIDLRRSHIHDLDPLRDWKRVELSEGDSLTIRPGQTVMGRIYERFRMPESCAGKIEGRSSFARLGLAVHCTGDFINPGWNGYMPLQLVNLGPYPVRLTPYLDICQLKLVRLSGTPERSYGDAALRSKYINDDGGPSLWWRDARIRELQQRLGEVHATERMINEVVSLVRFRSPEILERFQDFVHGHSAGSIDNADALLDEFAKKENRRKLVDRIAMGSPAVTIGALFGSFFAGFGIAHWMVGVATVVSIGAALAAYVRHGGGYLGGNELLDARNRPPNDA